MASGSALTAGKRLGPYEIVAPLGAGGMGEVYRARDARLRREVAVKVLPADVAGDPARRARFEQEAHAAAALNHPNILGIHDVGTEDGVSFIATELVVGDTLSAIIDRGAIPIRTLLDIAAQIADGMSAAHAAGIVHRDLKPANVMVTADGRVKILDFGLAKQTARPTGDSDDTVLVDHTEPGMIVGTVSYMSPEQARGKTADYRSDQFSFGLVLYEMAAGRKAFDKAESVQTMAAIIAEEPPPIEKRVPAPLRWVIDRCLAKDPAGRYESSRDLSRELRNIRDHLSEVSTQVEKVEVVAPTGAAAPARRRIWGLAAAALAGAALMLALIVWRAGPALPDQSSYRFTPFSFEPGGQSGAVWSQDGKAVAYAARQKTTDPYQVYVRYLDAPTAVQLTTSSATAVPVAWSPDSRRILILMSKDKPALWSLAAVGGEPELFLSLPDTPIDVSPNPSRVAVSRDNKSVAVLKMPGDALHVMVSSPGGAPFKTYEPEPFTTKLVFNQPRIRFSPDGKRLLLLVNGGRQGEETWLLPFPADGTAPASILSGMPSHGGTPTGDWMPDNRHLVLTVQPERVASAQLWLADTVSGERHVLTSGTAGYLAASVAPDGDRLIFAEPHGNFDIVAADLGTGAVFPVIATERDEVMPAWAASAPVMVYVSNRRGPNEIWMHRDGAPDRPIVTAGDFPDGATVWFMGPAPSPRGDRVVYTRIETGSTAKLWISALAGGTPIQLTNDTTSAEFPGSWSPDGAWFTYYALRDTKVRLMKVRASGQSTPVALKEGEFRSMVPIWSPDGKWILHTGELISPDGQTTRPIPDLRSSSYVFSPDGSLLYGLRSDGDQQVLFSFDIASGREKLIGSRPRDYPPASNLTPSMRFTLSPDRRSFVFGSGQFKTNLWMLEGFTKTKGPFSALLR